ncbi:hypothetical protein Cmtc_02940 [Cupriavidus sp. TKC]|nr:hypothetical protein Cmtc_02940 [Cupriavidus sp. TKC]
MTVRTGVGDGFAQYFSEDWRAGQAASHDRVTDASSPQKAEKPGHCPGKTVHLVLHQGETAGGTAMARRRLCDRQLVPVMVGSNTR